LKNKKGKRLPDFLIVGSMKCGTTTFYKNLIKHPSIVGAREKELRFFSKDRLYNEGLNWYRKQFPLFVDPKYKGQEQLITGEATPKYIFLERVPERVYKAMPNAKLIVLLRNPVDRAFSHYHHYIRRDIEPLSFKEAITIEEKGIIRKNYLLRGIYVNQLKRWMKLFPKDQILILRSEDYFSDPIAALNKASHFLGLSDWEGTYLPGKRKHKSKLDDKMRKRLIKYYKPHNKRLYQYLGKDFMWDK
jgi:hypothetical protein